MYIYIYIYNIHTYLSIYLLSTYMLHISAHLGQDWHGVLEQHLALLHLLRPPHNLRNANGNTKVRLTPLAVYPFLGFKPDI